MYALFSRLKSLVPSPFMAQKSKNLSKIKVEKDLKAAESIMEGIK